MEVNNQSSHSERRRGGERKGLLKEGGGAGRDLRGRCRGGTEGAGSYLIYVFEL